MSDLHEAAERKAQRKRTMYAVVEENSFVQDAAAMFDDQTHAETHAEMMSNDSDYDGRYRVVPVDVDANTIIEQEPTP
jgi:hypothetical protein